MRSHHLEPLEKRRLLASFVVNTTADPATWDSSDNVISLREAVAAANASAGNDTITLPAGVYPIAHGELAVTDTTGALAIDGLLATATIDAGGTSRIFNITAGASLHLADLTLINGNAVNGGAIHNQGTVTLSRCTLDSNKSVFYGGAIYNFPQESGTSSVTLTDCILTRNLSSQGAAVMNLAFATGALAKLDVSGSVFQQNDGGLGGALANQAYDGKASTHVIDSSFTENDAAGAAFLNEVWETGEAELVIHGSDMSRNVSSTNGGAIYDTVHSSGRSVVEIVGCTLLENYAPSSTIDMYSWHPQARRTLTIRDSTIANNLRGGALHLSSRGLTHALVTQSTIHNNPGGIANTVGGVGAGFLTVTHSTVTDNKANSGILSSPGGGTTTLHNTVVAGNIADTLGVNLHGVFDPASSYNLLAIIDDRASGFAADGNGNLTGTATSPVDPKLAALDDNGGPTPTRALLPDSPALDAGDPGFVPPPAFDQRGAGFDRVSGGRIDIGAFEVQAPTNAMPTTTGIADITVPEDSADSLVNLRDFFDDAEDGPAGLAYTIVGNTNPALFASASIDPLTDVLTLDYAADAHGAAQVTIRATDTGGLFVEESFAITVLSVPQQLANLRAQVNALPGLNHGNSNALLAKLNLKGNNGDFGKLGAFIDAVNNMIGNGKISQQDGDALLSAAEDLLVSLR